MHATMPAPARQLVSAEEVDRFRQVVEIHDEQRFRQMLNELLAAKAGNEPDRPSTADERQAILERMRASPASQPVQRWEPTRSQIEQGRILGLQKFNQPHNLPLERYAELAGLSRQHVYKLIKARKLLALKIAGHGVRIPDWQLDPLPASLTRAVMERGPTAGPWELYDWLRLPEERFGDRAPIDIVTPANLEELTVSLLGALGFQA